MILTQIAIDITNQFDCYVIMEACTKLIQFLHSQLNEDNKIQNKIGETFKRTFNVSSDQRLLYNNMILHFLNILTGRGSEFYTKLVSLHEWPNEHNVDVASIIWYIIHYIKASVNSSTTNGNCGDYKFCLNYINASLNSSSTNEDCSGYVTKCCQILCHLLDLRPDKLLHVVNPLLSEENNIEVRIKILYLFNEKLKLSMNRNDAFLPVLGNL